MFVFNSPVPTYNDGNLVGMFDFSTWICFFVERAEAIVSSIPTRKQIDQDFDDAKKVQGEFSKRRSASVGNLSTRIPESLECQRPSGSSEYEVALCIVNHLWGRNPVYHATKASRTSTTTLHRILTTDSMHDRTTILPLLSVYSRVCP